MNPLADDIALIVESGLFDDDYYRHFHADLPEDADLVRHYLRFGARRGDDPSELFSTTGYQRQNVDVAKSGANPLSITRASGGTRAGSRRAADCASPTSTASSSSSGRSWRRCRSPTSRRSGRG